MSRGSTSSFPEDVVRPTEDTVLPDTALDASVSPVSAARGVVVRAPDSLEPALPGRYEDRGRIAQGASGDVRRVYDRLLGCSLAMKVLRWEHLHSPRMHARFLAEAEVTARLQHPGVIPVHERGTFDDGRPWFTMREVRGRTFEEVIEELHAARGPSGFEATPSGLSFRRVVDAFARLVQTVAYAHEQGVMHRDLKPTNLMVGEHGEAFVMDWGLARRVGELSPGEPTEQAPVSGEGEGLTLLGEVLGTPSYMAPEQAQGETHLHGKPSDVYALGAILYHLLTGRAPYEGSSSFAVWRQVLAGPPRRIAEVVGADLPLPRELVLMCEKAMQRAPLARYPDAGALAREVFAWLDGARRREQARAVLAEASLLLPEIAALGARAEELSAEARRLWAGVRPSDPVEVKRPIWALEDEAGRVRQEASRRVAARLSAAQGALILDPELPEAHALLADHYAAELVAAESAERHGDAAQAEALLRAHDRGQHAALLRGDGALSLSIEPEGAQVLICRYISRDRRLWAEPLRVLSPGPLREVSLPRGSYLLLVSAPGYEEVRLPVLLERGAHWTGAAPGETEPFMLRLPRRGVLGPDDCYVPAGYAFVGGDVHAPDSLPGRRVWVDGFVMRRYPVTNEEYLAFLNALVVQGREDEALSYVPRVALGMSEARDERPLFGRDAAGRFVLGVDESGASWLPRWPVANVDWYAARAYAQHVATCTGQPWRLPNELEREKAARGADGRVYPWGDYADATFACVLESHEGVPARVEVDTYPADESPYGVRGLSGNSRDWCGNVWRREGPLVVGERLLLDEASPEDPEHRVVRGGGWSSALSFARVAGRFGLLPRMRRATVGLRLVRSFSGVLADTPKERG